MHATNYETDIWIPQIFFCESYIIVSHVMKQSQKETFLYVFRFRNEYFDHSLITISVCQSELQAYLQNMIELDITANEVLYGICTLRVSITVVFYITQYCN